MWISHFFWRGVGGGCSLEKLTNLFFWFNAGVLTRMSGEHKWRWIMMNNRYQMKKHKLNPMIKSLKEKPISLNPMMRSISHLPRQIFQNNYQFHVFSILGWFKVQYLKQVVSFSFFHFFRIVWYICDHGFKGLTSSHVNYRNWYSTKEKYKERFNFYVMVFFFHLLCNHSLINHHI